MRKRTAILLPEREFGIDKYVDQGNNLGLGSDVEGPAQRAVGRVIAMNIFVNSLLVLRRERRAGGLALILSNSLSAFMQTACSVLASAGDAAGPAGATAGADKGPTAS